ncbi:hypothetical protein VNO80_03994 [Phaseolus coccineus]|uniref:Uncharacterized protein n=1 Tax=Phaseolus coccineus TaxID=3886 RepID=A0AAN9NU59_PHACN
MAKIPAISSFLMYVFLPISMLLLPQTTLTYVIIAESGRVTRSSSCYRAILMTDYVIMYGMMRVLNAL